MSTRMHKGIQFTSLSFTCEQIIQALVRFCVSNSHKTSFNCENVMQNFHEKLNGKFPWTSFICSTSDDEMTPHEDRLEFVLEKRNENFRRTFLVKPFYQKAILKAVN